VLVAVWAEHINAYTQGAISICKVPSVKISFELATAISHFPFFLLYSNFIFLLNLNQF